LVKLVDMNNVSVNNGKRILYEMIDGDT